jgi:tryptophan-rich sensory protein
MIGSVLPYVFAALPVALGMTVGWVSGSKSRTQYNAMKKPAWNPPPVVFAPVWTVLYVLMGVASIPVFKLWQQGVPGAGTALLVYVASLAVNLSWTPAFFMYNRVDVALAIILVLLALIVVVAVLFSRLTRAWLLLVPYVIWVAYATTLNAAILHMNK